MTLSSLPLFEVEYAGRQITKENEDYCGDSVSFAESDEGYSYCFICDGMGSGREAALTARICRIFLEKMLACGNKKSTTLEMLNMIIAGKGVECFATVDLLEVDLMLGTASFIKSGATPSYVIRGESLFKIASSTAPIGIMPRLVAEMTEFDLRDGDIIVLSSDGIAANDTPDGDGGLWLSELLESADKKRPRCARGKDSRGREASREEKRRYDGRACPREKHCEKRRKGTRRACSHGRVENGGFRRFSEIFGRKARFSEPIRGFSRANHG